MLCKKSLIETRFAPHTKKSRSLDLLLYGADVHKGFNNNAGTYNLFSFKRTFSKSPLLRYNVLAKEDFAL